MEWFVSQLLNPVARRVGGQASAALVALGMAGQHQAAVAAAIAWAIVTAAEVIVSDRSRRKLVSSAKNAWGRN